jgi:hypothetical protein
MSQPSVPITRNYSFSGFQASNPSTPLPAAQVDAELDRVFAALTATVQWAATTLAADGTLKGGTVGDAQIVPGTITGDGGGAEAWADASRAWAEHMPGTLPADTITRMNLTGAERSARWWADQAQQAVYDAPAAIAAATTANTAATDAANYANAAAVAATNAASAATLALAARITVSTATPFGTANDGDIWFQV